LDLSGSTLAGHTPTRYVGLSEYHGISNRDKEENGKVKANKESSGVLPSYWLFRSKLQWQANNRSAIVSVVPVGVIKIRKAKHWKECNQETNNPDNEAQNVRRPWRKSTTIVREHNILKPVSGDQRHHH